MQTRVFQLLVDNNSGVLSRITGLFSRRGYNIESITAGVTADPRFTRITIVTSGDEEILDQIEKQVAKLVDVRDIHELKPAMILFSAAISISGKNCSIYLKPIAVETTTVSGYLCKKAGMLAEWSGSIC